MSEEKRKADLYSAVAKALEVEASEIITVSLVKSKPDSELDTYNVLVKVGNSGNARRATVPAKGIGKRADLVKANKIHAEAG